MFGLIQPTTTSFDKTTLRFVKVLSSSRFPVILVEDSNYLQTFVLKLFPFVEGNYARAFLQETSVLSLDHPNIITLHHAFPRYSLTPGEDPNTTPLSAVAMEHAANGDLCRLLKYASCNLSEEAVRTLFHQLINGLEFLHNQGLAHLDLKPDNLLLGEDFTLKIGDFDQVTPIQNTCTLSKGTPGYRAPEVKGQNCCNLAAADIFSAGVVLFVMKSRVPPFVERKLGKTSMDLYEELIKEDNSRFWEIHSKAQKTDRRFFSESFKNLIAQMLHPDPEKRPFIDEIKKSEWYNGPVLGQESLKDELSGL